jgi:hypothetical protein
MSLLDFFRDRWKTEAVHSTYEFIDFSRSDHPTASSPIRSGEQYFRITVAEMYLKNDKEWFTNRSPAVYSVVSLRFGDKQEVFSHVSGPSGLKDLKAESLNRGVTINYPLMALTPFNGGDIEIEAGLVSLPGSNEAKRLLKVLTNFSKTLAVPQLSVALSFAQPLADGIADLVGSDEAQLVLRLHDMFMQNSPIRCGYMVSIDAKAGDINPNELWVKGDRLLRGPSLNEAKPLTGYHYTLMRVDAVDERDDYQFLSSIDGPYQSAITALNEAVLEPDPQKQKDKMMEAERLLSAAKVAAFKAKELTFKSGRRQVITALQKNFDEARSLLAPGVAEQPVARTLEQAMANTISVQEALIAGDVTVKDLE